MAEVGWKQFVERRDSDGLQQPRVPRMRKSTRVDRDQNVSGRSGTFALQALDKLVVLGLHDIDLDPGRACEGIPESLVATIVARAEDVDVGGVRRGNEKKARKKQGRKAEHGEVSS
jgi:hypothetical protein